MRKYGKYEKRPEGVAVKQPKVKSALLQTYFTSLLSMVLCVAMFFGTSYAWFTSEVENTGNEIYIGTLDVDLQKQVPDGDDADTEPDYVSLSETDASGNNTTQLFDRGIRWEPGYTALETIQVVNEGDLAFNYTLKFINASDTDVADVADYFDVWVYSNDAHTAYSKTEGETFAQMTQKDGWEPIGTLADVLEGKAVFSGSMTAENVVDQDGNKVNTTHTYTIALHMKEDAKNTTDEHGNNFLMGKSISLNVKLIAYQMASEKDGFGNSSYDDTVFVTNNKELQAALENATGNTVICFANDIIGNVTVTQKEGVNITIDGDSNKYTGTIYINGNSRHDQAETLIIRNIAFVADTETDFISSNETTSVGRYAHNVTIQNCSFTGTGNNAKVMGARFRQAYNITLKNCTAAGMYGILWSTGSTNITVDTVIATNCRNGISVGNTTATIQNCDIVATEYGIRADGDNGSTLTLKDNKISAKQPVIVRNLTAAGYTLNLSGNILTATGSGTYQVILTRASDDVAYVSPDATHYTITGGEGLSIYQ